MKKTYDNKRASRFREIACVAAGVGVALLAVILAPPAAAGSGESGVEPEDVLSAAQFGAQRQALRQMQVRQQLRWSALMATATPEESAGYLAEAEMLGAPPGGIMMAVSHRGVPRSIWGCRMAILGDGTASSPEEAALSFLEDYASAWAMEDPKGELWATGVRRTAAGTYAVRFEQLTSVGRVFNTQIIVEVSAEGAFVSMSGLYLPNAYKYSFAPVSEAEARDVLAATVEGVEVEIRSAELGIFEPEAFGIRASPSPAWVLEASLPENDLEVYVDALAGTVLHERILSDSDKKEEVYDCPGCSVESQMPGNLVWKTGSRFPLVWPGSSQPVYQFTDDVYEYFANVHFRDSWDNLPASQYHRMRVSADLTPGNSHWYPTKRQVGLGSDLYCLDVVAHEFTHAVDFAESNLLGGAGECGALNESYPDVFGEFVEEWATGSADWSHATGSGCPNGPERSLSSPCAVDGTIDHWSRYCDGMNCSSYDNMGIASKAAYLIGASPPHTETFWGMPVSSIGASDASLIWYDVLANAIGGNDGFATFGRKTIMSALAIFGTDDRFIQTRAAIYSVGIWTGEGELGLESDRSIALIPQFDVGGQFRKWVFWKGPGQPLGAVLGAWRTCSLRGACQWSSPIDLGASTARSISAVVFGGKIWVFFTLANGIIYLTTIDSTGSVSVPTWVGGGLTTAADPSACVVGGKLVLAYKEYSSGRLAAIVHDGASWGQPVVSSFAAFDGVRSVAGLDGSAWVNYTLWDPYSSSYMMHFALFNVGWNIWSNEWSAWLQTALNQVPTAAIYRGRYHLVGVGFNFDPALNDMVRYSSCGPTYNDCVNTNQGCGNAGSTAFVQQDNDLSPGQQHPTLFSDTVENILYLIVRHPGSDALYWRYKASE